MSESNVVTALAAVMADLPAIGKDSQASSQQGGYAYRGIEAITRACQSLFAKNGLIFAPHIVEGSVETVELTVNGKPWTDTRMLVRYTVHHGPSNTQLEVGPILAIGRDNSDKGASKCMTQAFKYALLQVLCVSDAKDDGDQASHEADDRGQREEEQSQRIPEWQTLGWDSDGALIEAVEVVKRRWERVTDDVLKDEAKGWLKDHGYSARWPFKRDDYAPYLSMLDNLLQPGFRDEHNLTPAEPVSLLTPETAPETRDLFDRLAALTARFKQLPVPAQAQAMADGKRINLRPLSKLKLEDPDLSEMIEGWGAVISNVLDAAMASA